MVGGWGLGVVVVVVVRWWSEIGLVVLVSWLRCWRTVVVKNTVANLIAVVLFCSR